jgi:CDP-glycerol glycerophosphotransferase (TagB/SpsB family)
MIENLRNLTYLIYRFFPKWNHAVIWGWPDYVDSVIALETVLQKTPITRVILLMTDVRLTPPWDLGIKTSRVKKNSLLGWLVFCSARYVFFTHRCFMRHFPPNVISVNLWHGMPIKRTGKMLEGDEVISSKYALATSPFWAAIMERTIASPGTAFATGLPQNDRLFSSREQVIEKLGVPQASRLIAWLPTYRTSVRGLLRTDGIEMGNVFEMPDVDPEQLNEFLKTRDTILLVKPHPMAAFDEPKTWSHLWIVDIKWLQERCVSLYEFLGATELLISDISSVVIDYLLLNRPIIHAFADLKEYEDSRGFTVEPVADYFMGPVVTTYPELCKELDQHLAGNDLYADQRQAIRTLSHSHLDAGSGQRLLETLGLG